MAKFDYATPMADLRSADAARQDSAYHALLGATRDRPAVDWAYAVWDDLLHLMKKGDNRQRSIASQALCGLAASDPEERMVKDVKALLTVTKDERFVTARHCLQALWKVGVAGERQRAALLKGLVARFKECVTEKNCTLIRFDILTAMRQVYNVAADPSWRSTAETLMALEEDPKYRKKYATVWRK